MTDAIPSRAALIAAALELRDQGLGYVRIGRALGVSTTTARRLSKPGYNDHLKDLARANKARRKQPCSRGCGNLTSYDRPGGVCADCYNDEREPEHGTYTRYNSKKWACRCADCRAAWAAKMRDYYRRTKVAS